MISRMDLTKRSALLWVVTLASFGVIGAANGSIASDSDRARAIQADLTAREDGKFDQLLKRWEGRYGTKAVPPLLKIASDRRQNDADRYVALMGAARLGGTDVAPVIAHYLSDRSWMIRSGALRALRALGHPETGPAVLPLLRDPALVVRSEAVETIEKLRPAGSEEALISVLEHGANYHSGKAQWVPQKALKALVTLKASSAAPRLRPLLKHERDPKLQAETVATLEALTGRTVKKGAPLAERIRAWETSFDSAPQRAPASN